MEKLFITAADGYWLSALYFDPPGRTKGVIVISSATGVKKEFYINFSRHLFQKGYTVLLYDYRGIGASEHQNLKTLQSNMRDWGILDMNAVMNYLINVRDFTEVTWLGHSVGAQLVGFIEPGFQKHITRVIALNAALGYWRHFPFPMNLFIWFLWFAVGPLLVRAYGFGNMKLIGWGENLPKNIMLEWRHWCLSRSYYGASLKKALTTDKFYGFKVPTTAIYVSDDFIANDKTVPLMQGFFPDAPYKIRKIIVTNHTLQKVGHTGLFRKKFKRTLWPLLLNVIEGKELYARSPQYHFSSQGQTRFVSKAFIRKVQTLLSGKPAPRMD